MAADTRDRMIEATVDALRRHGIAGMSFTEVLRESGAARGAIYHHFPKGKAQLVCEAAELNGRQVAERFSRLPAQSPEGVVEAFLALVRPVVQASAQGSGCAVAAVTVDAGVDAGGDELRRIAAGAFDTWTDRLAERLVTAGLDDRQASDVATTLVTLLEGAHVLCRASGNLEPFDRVARTARSLLRS
jgi:AcrR family transcriptional regulator